MASKGLEFYTVSGGDDFRKYHDFLLSLHRPNPEMPDGYAGVYFNYLLQGTDITDPRDESKLFDSFLSVMGAGVYSRFSHDGTPKSALVIIASDDFGSRESAKRALELGTEVNFIEREK